MKKLEVLLVFSLFFVFNFIFVSSELIGDELSVNVNLLEPVVNVEIETDYISFRDIAKGYLSEAKQINITNFGTTDILFIPVLKNPSEIFENLYFYTSKGSAGSLTGYKKIGEFNGSVEKADVFGESNTEDFFIKLNLKDYGGEIDGNLTASVIFYVMPLD